MSALPPLIPVPINLIGMDDQGRPAIVNQPKIRVSMVVEAMRGPDRPTIDELATYWHKVDRADILAALCYYESHKANIDAYIAQTEAELERFFAEQNARNAPTLERLRKIKAERLAVASHKEE